MGSGASVRSQMTSIAAAPAARPSNWLSGVVAAAAPIIAKIAAMAAKSARNVLFCVTSAPCGEGAALDSRRLYNY